MDCESCVFVCLRQVVVSGLILKEKKNEGDGVLSVVS
jgi:hypothetical protein